MSKLFTLDFRIISLDLFQTNSLHSHLKPRERTKKTTWGARLHLQEQRAQTNHRQMEPHIQNLAKWSRVASHSGDWTIGNIARQTSRTRIEESTWFKSKNRNYYIINTRPRTREDGLGLLNRRDFHSSLRVAVQLRCEKHIGHFLALRPLSISLKLLLHEIIEFVWLTSSGEKDDD